MITRAIYTVLLTLVAPFLLYGLFRNRDGKPAVGKRWKEHLGFSRPLPKDCRPIWIHAVSVGETIASVPLIRQIKERNPSATILLTTTTPTGAKQAESLSELVEHRYMPIDFCFAVQRFLNTFNPKKLLIIETELWPNTLKTVSRAGIPVTIVNARLSEKSYLGYKRIKPLFNQISPALTQVLCQYESDAERFEKLGVQRQKINVTGSIKFDIEVSDTTSQESQRLREELGIDRPIWVAASTHQGEDEIVLAAHKQLKTSLPNALLILVPRHPERFTPVTELANNKFEAVTRTSSDTAKTSTEVYIGDTMGEMLTLIGASDVCFMGGSLLGKKIGGHNLLEPAALKKPILTGPSYFNFTDITESLIAVKACQKVYNAEELASTLVQLLSNKEKAKMQGLSAYRVIEQSSGALAKTLDHINL